MGFVGEAVNVGLGVSVSVLVGISVAVAVIVGLTVGVSVIVAAGVEDGRFVSVGVGVGGTGGVKTVIARIANRITLPTTTGTTNLRSRSVGRVDGTGKLPRYSSAFNTEFKLDAYSSWDVKSM